MAITLIGGSGSEAAIPRARERTNVLAPMLPVRRHTNLRAMADGTQLTTATYNGIEHIIVPVIALTAPIVVWPMNAPSAEFVPLSVLSQAPGGWNGRPIIPDHPKDGDGSANNPILLESAQFGYMFNARIVRGALQVDAWLDPIRAAILGGDALSVVERCQAGEMVEVSVGAFIGLQPKSGTYNGKSYESIWVDIVPDHLAMLPKGVGGACSIAVGGCGGPRLASKSTNRKIEAAKESSMKNSSGNGDGGGVPRLFSKFIELMGANPDYRLFNRADRTLEPNTDGMADMDLREKLYNALYAIEPAMFNVCEVYADTSTVVYSTWPLDSDRLYYQRTFTVSPDNVTVTLTDDRQRIMCVETYIVVADDADMPAEMEMMEGRISEMITSKEIINNRTETTETSCSCKKGDKAKIMATTATNTNSAPVALSAADKTTLINQIVGASASPFDTADVKDLDAMPDSALQVLATKYSAGAEGVDDRADDSDTGDDTDGEDGEVGATVAIPADELASLRAMAANYKAQDAAVRAQCIKTLSKAQKAIPATRLQTFDTQHLQELVMLSQAQGASAAIATPTPVSYLGLGFAAPPIDDSVDDSALTNDKSAAANPPNGYHIALKARGAKVDHLFGIDSSKDTN